MIENGFRFFSWKNEIVVSINQRQDVQRVNVNDNMAKTLTEIEKFKTQQYEAEFKKWFSNAKEKFLEK